MTFTFVKNLQVHISEQFQVTEPDIQWELCPQEYEGDVTVNCFRLAPLVRKPPQDIAQAVESYLQSHPDIEDAYAVKAFVNITLSSTPLFQETVANESTLLHDAELPPEQRQSILIEYSAPNTNKPQHLGHVRNNALGQAATSLLKRTGHTVTPVNLINDRGIHVCQSMLAYQRWGGGKTPASANRKGDHFVGDFYVMFQQEQQRQLTELRQQQPALADKPDEELLLHTEIGRAAQDLLIAWEEGDPEVLQLWCTMNEWVMQGFQETYNRMGVEFERMYFESETYKHGRDIVQQGQKDGVFEQKPDGSVLCNLEEEQLGEKIVLRSDGTSVYVTQDLGTTLIKQDEFEPDEQVWVVGDEQNHHFKVLFAILRKLGYNWAENLTHLPYGMIDLPTGKMKSREGKVVDADELFDEMEELARDATLSRTNGEAPPDIEERTQAIAMAAVKFMLLNVKTTTRLTFDPDSAIRFEGDTGPYVQYACARISSILRKAGINDAPDLPESDWSLLGTAEEKELALQCAHYGSVVRKAAAELDTARLTQYLLQLAKAFNRFYRECSVLNAPTTELRDARLVLTSRVLTLLTDGLRTLTITPLTSM